METHQTRIFFHDLPETPVGRVQGAGYVKDTWRLSTWPMRVLNTYALVYVTEGGGHFCDTGGKDLEILAGDLILLFPNLPHAYGPKPGGKWSEVYAHFNGPVFDVWRQAGLLDPEKPVHRLLPVEQWRTELGTILDRPVGDETAQMVMLCDFLGLLTRMLAASALVNAGDGRPRWLQNALALLDSDSEQTPLLPADRRQCRDVVPHVPQALRAGDGRGACPIPVCAAHGVGVLYAAAHEDEGPRDRRAPELQQRVLLLQPLPQLHGHESRPSTDRRAAWGRPRFRSAVPPRQIPRTLKNLVQTTETSSPRNVVLADGAAQGGVGGVEVVDGGDVLVLRLRQRRLGRRHVQDRPHPRLLRGDGGIVVDLGGLHGGLGERRGLSASARVP